MQFSVHITDDAIRRQLDKQISANIARVTDELIKKRIHEIVDVKSWRITPDRFDQMIGDAVAALVAEYIRKAGLPQFREAVNVACENVIRNNIQKG